MHAYKIWAGTAAQTHTRQNRTADNSMARLHLLLAAALLGSGSLAAAGTIADELLKDRDLDNVMKVYIWTLYRLYF